MTIATYAAERRYYDDYMICYDMMMLWLGATAIHLKNML